MILSLTISVFIPASANAIGKDDSITVRYSNGSTEKTTLRKKVDAYCQKWDDRPQHLSNSTLTVSNRQTCVYSYEAGFNDVSNGKKDVEETCKADSKYGQSFVNAFPKVCRDGYLQGAALYHAVANAKDSKLRNAISSYCNKETKNSSQKKICENAAINGALGFNSKEDVCRPYSGNNKTICETAYDKGDGVYTDIFPRASTDTGKESFNCDANWSPLSWIACPIIDMGTGMTDYVFKNFIKPLLQNIPISTEDGDGGFIAWQTFRVLGNAILIGALLIMVFAQNFDRFVDAYTIKKMAPRIVAGVIAINLSYFICLIAISVINVVSVGMNQILVQPFLDGFSPPDGLNIASGVATDITGLLGMGLLAGSVGLVFAVGLGTSAVAILGLILPFIVTVMLVAIAALFTVVLRQALIIFLTVISPVAIAAFILPGTEKYARKWWDLFLKTLIVYPIIAVIFAMSNVMGIILMSSAGGGTLGVAQIITTIIVVYAPLALVPFSFKFAGGAIGAIGGFATQQANKWSAAAGQRIRKSREDPNSWLGGAAHRARQQRTEKGLTSGQIMSGLTSGVRARAKGRSFRTAYSAGSAVKSRGKVFDEATAFMENNEAFKTFAGNDDAVWAFRQGGSEEDIRRNLQQRGVTDPLALAETTSAIMRARGQAGDHVADIAAVRAQAKTGTGWENNTQMLSDIVSASGGDMALAGRTLAETRGSVVQAGQVHLGSASFNTQMQAMEQINQSMLNNGLITPGVAAVVENNVMDSVIDSATPGQTLYGKVPSVQAIARGHVRRIQEISNGIQAGTHTRRDLDQALATTMGIHDAMASAAPQNARAMADILMNSNITDPANSGENNQPLQTNIFDFANSENTVHNPGFVEMRQHFARDTLGRAQAEAAHVQQQAQQATQGNQQGPPPTNPGSGMPT